MEKELPRDIKSETEVISSILYNPKNLTSVIELLDPEDFYNSKLQLIYETMLNLFAEDSPIEITAIAHKLGAEGLKRVGGVSHLTELLTSGYSTNFEYYCKIIKDKSRRRALIKSCNLTQHKAYDEKIDVSDLVGDFQNSILDKRNKSSIKSNAVLLGNTIEAIEERYKNGGGIPGMKTGFSCFNKSTNGLKKGELVVIAGRPSMGKTLIALHLADGLSENGSKVGLFEMEMSEESLGTRRIAYKARVEASKLQRGEISPEEWERITEAYNKVSRNDNLFTDCSEDNSVIDIKAKAKMLKQS
ncbi:MAG: replicative DNA helicase, partial [Clostridium sp.]